MLFWRAFEAIFFLVLDSITSQYRYFFHFLFIFLNFFLDIYTLYLYCLNHALKIISTVKQGYLLDNNVNSNTISSKELIAKTGISRATLNNYISLNLIPSPAVRRPEEPGGPTKIGYFPIWVADRIERIQEMKSTGMRMAEIALHFMDEGTEGKEIPRDGVLDFTYQSIERIVFPAILVNSSWEIIWINQSAERVFFQESVREIPTAANRNILRLFLEKGLPGRFKNWKEILTLHLRLAKRDLTEDRVEQICRQVETCPLEELKELWSEVEALQEGPITQQDLVLRPYKGKNSRHTLFSSDFREGTLLLYTPVNMQLDQILNLLMKRKTGQSSVVTANSFPHITVYSGWAVRVEPSSSHCPAPPRVF